MRQAEHQTAFGLLMKKCIGQLYHSATPVIVAKSGSRVLAKAEINCQVRNCGSPLGSRRLLVATDYRSERGPILAAIEARWPFLDRTRHGAFGEPKQKRDANQRHIVMTRTHAAAPQMTSDLAQE
jgi:hypothetical protein